MQKISTFLFSILATSVMYGQYCLPTYNSQCTSGDYINSVSVNTIVNTGTGCSNPGVSNYTDYTGAFSTTFFVDSTYSISVSPGPTWGQYFVAFIDFNQDLDFADAGEFFNIGYATGGATIAANITVPYGALLGTTTMRVMCRYSTGALSQTDVCATGLSFGEVEDYMVVIDVAPLPVTDETSVICANDTLVVNGNPYYFGNSTGTEVFSNIGFYLQDSTVNVDLGFLPTSDSTIAATICANDTLMVNGTAYTVTNLTGTEVFVAGSINGCDSIVTINLNASDLSVTNTFPTLMANQAGATYQWLDCDNAYAIIPGETGQSFTATSNGDFAVEITFNGCTDTSACATVSGVGIYENSNEALVSIFPNPSTGLFTISLAAVVGEVTMTITSIEGKVVRQVNNVNTNNVEVDLSGESKGVYLITITGDEINEVYKVLVK